MKKIYVQGAVDEKIAEIEEGVNRKNPGTIQTISIKKVCCSPFYYRSTIIGCMLAVFQQTTGINIFVFYSNELFTNLGSDFPPSLITGLIGSINFVFSLIGILLLGYFGRRKLMLFGYILMTIALVGLGISTILSTSENLTDGAVYGELASIALFIMAYETSAGPVTWVYLAEIMQDKAFSFANFTI